MDTGYNIEQVRSLVAAIWGLKANDVGNAALVEELVARHAPNSAAVDELLSSLGPRHLEMFRRRYFGRQTLHEIGQHFSITRSAVQAIIAKDLPVLRRLAEVREALRQLESARDLEAKLEVPIMVLEALGIEVRIVNILRRGIARGNSIAEKDVTLGVLVRWSAYELQDILLVGSATIDQVRQALADERVGLTLAGEGGS